MIFLWIIVAILIFTVVILIHEYGHFKTSRYFGVKVEEFGLGIPPKAKRLWKDKMGTIYTLNWLPLGWFVRLKWENIHALKNKNDKDALINKPAWQQSIIILAGVFMNFLLAIVVFSILFFVWVKPIWVNDRIETNLDLKLIPTMEQAIDRWILIKNPWIALYPVEDSIAEKSWIISWDILTHIDGNIVNTPEKVMEIISSNPSKEIELKISDKIIKIIPSSEWKIWSYIWENITINKEFEYKYWFFESIKEWTLETYSQSILTFKAIWILIRKIFNPINNTERKEAINEMKWPIWMVDFISSSIGAGLIFLIILWAIISINLWVFNLLPIPALDWWRFLFILINSIISSIFWRKAINEKNENIINFVFFMFLIALSLLIAYNDIHNIINK